MLGSLVPRSERSAPCHVLNGICGLAGYNYLNGGGGAISMWQHSFGGWFTSN